MIRKVLVVLFFVITLAGCQEHYFGEDINEAQKVGAYNDALFISNAATAYCAANTCSTTQEFTWNDLVNYIDDVNDADYDLTANNGIIAVLDNSAWKIYLEKDGTGTYEFPQGMVPIGASSDDCIIDDN